MSGMQRMYARPIENQRRKKNYIEPDLKVSTKSKFPFESWLEISDKKNIVFFGKISESGENQLNCDWIENCDFFLSHSLATNCNWSTASVSHNITLFHSLVLTLDLFSKSDKFIAFNTTVGLLSNWLQLWSVLGYLYHSIDRMEGSMYNISFISSRIDKWTLVVWTEKQTSDWIHTATKIGNGLLFEWNRLYFRPIERFNYMCWTMLYWCTKTDSNR